MFVGYGWLEGHWIDVTHACSSVARKLVFFCRTLPRSRRRFQHLLQWEFCRYYSQIQLDPASDDRFTEIHFALIRVSVQGPIFLFFFGGSASLRSPRSGEHPLPVSKCRACSVLTIPWCKALSLHSRLRMAFGRFFIFYLTIKVDLKTFITLHHGLNKLNKN